MKKNSLLYILAILAIIGGIYSFINFDRAFPIVNVKISADKNDIIQKADSLNQTCAFIDSSYRSVVGFDTDTRFKNYIELEGGGVEVFQNIVNSGIYHPFYWAVRQYNFNEIKECYVYFSPDGKPLGFKITLPDSLPGPDIKDLDIDRILKDSESRTALLADLSLYDLIEESSEVKEGGRRDHILTYELKDAGVGEAHYRYKIGISGNELTMAVPVVKIPETYDRRYEEMRSANSTIAYVGQAIMLLLYGVFGVGLAIFFMVRKGTLCWKPALKWAGVIGGMVFLAYLTSIALSWFQYDTSLSSGQFLMQQIFMALLNGLLIGVIFFASATAGTGLDRQAFPDHIQFWKSWSPTVGASKDIMRMTVFGYLWAIVILGFVTFFYWFTNHVLNWWSPAENMVDPNVLALPMPWLLPSAMSLQAGFWEEVLFRAVPLAGAVLIAKKFKRKGLWIAFALLLQAVIFGSMHANYAQQPAYARIVEMIIPFCLYGLIYMNWGLLPVIISHFVYDILLMSLPLFIMSAPGIWIHRFLVILVMMIPLGVVVSRRIKAGSWYEIREEDLNAGYVPMERKSEDRKKEEPRNVLQEHRELPIIAAIAMLIIGAVVWTWLTPFEQDVPQLQISRQKAVKIAEALVGDMYPGTDSLDYHHYVRIESGVGREGLFVWEKGKQDIFRQLYANDLATNYFVVTFKTFEGDLVKRSETIDVNIGRDGEILGWNHQVPEPRPDEFLDELEAITMAEKAIMDHFGKDVKALELVKTQPEKMTARTDWTVIYRNTGTGLSEGDVRYVVRISGQELAGMGRMVHTSENWDREQKKSSVLKIVLLIISKLIQFGMLISVVIMGIVAWTKKHFNVRLFVYFFLGFVAISLLQGVLLANSIIGQYPTSEPYGNLILMLVIGIVLGAAVSGFLYAAPIGYMARLPLPVQRNEHVIGLKGTGLGLILAAGLAFTAGNAINHQPLVIAPLDLEAMHPLFASFLSAVEKYFVTMVMLMVPFVLVQNVSEGWRKRKILSLILLFLAGFAYVGKLSLGWWALGGSIMGLLMIGLYLWVLRYNMIYVPVITATLLVSDQLQYLFADPAILTLPNVILTSLVTILLAVFSVWGMYRVRILQPKKMPADQNNKKETD